MNAPLVSVMAPTYRRASWIGRALESLLGQELVNRECLPGRSPLPPSPPR